MAGDLCLNMSLPIAPFSVKTLVSFKFSIAQYSPCIDGLVLQYRTTVAKMLAKQANDPRNPAQFIITTFHPQIIHETDKVYGVSHQNRISRWDHAMFAVGFAV